MNGQMILVIFYGLLKKCLSEAFILAKYDYACDTNEELVHKEAKLALAVLKAKKIKTSKDFLNYLEKEYLCFNETYLRILKKLEARVISIEAVEHDYTLKDIFYTLYVYENFDYEAKLSINAIQVKYEIGFNKTMKIKKILTDLKLVDEDGKKINLELEKEEDTI